MSMIPTIGEMRQVVKFENVTKTTDATGGNEEGFSDWFTCRGCLQKNNSRRPFEMGVDIIVNDYDLFIPWRSEFESDISRDTQVIFQNRNFSVVNWELIQEERRVYKIHLKERV
jgi:head-tail adaptor